MTDRISCEEITELAPEVALGISSGEDRARVLTHAATCDTCRQLMHDLSAVADELLLAAPRREPAPGFETRVLDTIAAEAGPRSRWRRPMAAVAIAAVAASIAGGAVWFGTRSDREVGAYYREMLAQVQGDYFSATLLTAESREVGVVYSYEGKPSWVLVVLRDISKAGSYDVSTTTTTGKTVDLGSASLSADERAWAAELPVPVHDVESFRLESETITLIGRMPDH